MWSKFKSGVCGACKMVKDTTCHVFNNTVETVPSQSSKFFEDMKDDGKKFIDDPLCEKTEVREEEQALLSDTNNQESQERPAETNPFD